MKISFVHKFKMIISIIWESFHFFSRIFVNNFSVHIIASGDDNFDDAKMCLQIPFPVNCGSRKAKRKIMF